MKTFKTFINERAIDAVKIIDFLEGGTIEYIDDQENYVKRDITVNDLFEFVDKHFEAKTLGEGSYALVKKGAVGEDYILKVTKREDKAYERYTEVAMSKHDGNPLYPHILYSGTINGVPFSAQEVKVYLIEHLTIDEMRVNASSDYSSFRLFREANLIYRLCNKMQPFKYDLDENDEVDVLDGMEFLKDPNIHKHKFEHVIKAAGLLDSIENLGIRIKDLESWFGDYNKYFSGTNGSFPLDLHEKNLGWRKNGRCVFFDPIFSAGWHV